jgi:hypothetical protein
MMRMISLPLFTFLALAWALGREKRKRDSSRKRRAMGRRSSHPQADPFAGAKGKEKIGLLRLE